MTDRVDRQLAARLELRAALAVIAAKHPELTTTEAQARLESWLGEQEAQMTTEPTITVAARLPQSLVARLDAYATARSEPGLKLSRSDAVRVLVTKALDALATPEAKRNRRGK